MSDEKLYVSPEGLAYAYTKLKNEIPIAVEAEKGNIVDLLIQELQGLPVFGVVDTNNTIKITSQLSSGEYTLKYENTNGAYADVGIITIVDNKPNVPEVNYTNQITASINADGSEYVGHNGEDGYSAGYRINSSGVEGQQDGMCCTGYIQYNNETIRLKNVTVNGTKTPYIAEYDQSKTFIQVLALDSVLTDDGNGVLTGSIALNGYIRITCGVIDDTSILTLDTEIPVYTNLIDLTPTTDTEITTASEGWIEGYRISESEKIIKPVEGYHITNIIPVGNAQVLRIKNLDITTGYGRIYFYNDTTYEWQFGTSHSTEIIWTSATPEYTEINLLEFEKIMGSWGLSQYNGIRLGGIPTNTKENIIVTLDEEII